MSIRPEPHKLIGKKTGEPKKINNWLFGGVGMGDRAGEITHRLLVR